MNRLNTQTPESEEGLLRHPCFNQQARHTHARIHLPVAPRCNMQCNYCNRKYSCANESRPGVTCTVLKPGQAIEYLRSSIKTTPQLSVVGIAGPGDPMACASETLETLRLVRAEFPHLLLCIATNGLNLLPYAEDLAALGLSHITITMNAVDAAIGERFYRWIEIDGVRRSGRDAAELLRQRQQQAIHAMASLGVLVKVNTIYVPGYNDAHIEQVAQTASVLGASVLNLMPLLPTAGTPFSSLPEPDRKTLQNAREQAAKYLPQMSHCARCRADAAGFVGEPHAPQLLQAIARAEHPSAAKPVAPRLQVTTSGSRPYLAVGSRDGCEIDQHLGEADRFMIYRLGESGGQFVEARPVNREEEGATRWIRLAELLHDCAGVVVSGAGVTPRMILAHYGLQVGIVDGSVQEALTAVAHGGDLTLMAKETFHCHGLGKEQRGCT